MFITRRRILAQSQSGTLVQTLKLFLTLAVGICFFQAQCVTARLAGRIAGIGGPLRQRLWTLIMMARASNLDNLETRSQSPLALVRLQESLYKTWFALVHEEAVLKENHSQYSQGTTLKPWWET